MAQTTRTILPGSGMRVPPQDINAEVAILGSIMQKPDAIYDITSLISPATFYDQKNRIVYEAMLALFSKNTPIDIVSVSTKLKETGKHDSVGGDSYLAQVVSSVATPGHINHYAKIIQKKYLMRRLIDASQYISELGYDEANEIETLMDNAEKHIFEITNYSNIHQFTEIKDTLSAVFERIEKLSKSDDALRGVPTGFSALDNKLSGLQNSDLIILAARPSMGKTSLALDIARQAAVDHKVPVAIFSLEMTSQQLVDRMLSAQSRVDSWKLRTGKGLRDEDFASLSTALDILSGAPIYIDDKPGNNILQMRSVARRLKSEKNLGLIIVDYLQLMVPIETRKSDNIVAQVTETSRSLKNLAREIDVPVLCLSQLSRAVEQRGGKPRLSDLRDSGSIEQDADVVMFIHRDDKQNENSEKPNIAEILIEKHRNGPTGMAELYFDENRTSFLSLDNAKGGHFEAGEGREDDAFSDF